MKMLILADHLFISGKMLLADDVDNSEAKEIINISLKL